MRRGAGTRGKVAKRLIEQVTAGEKGIARLFNEEQEGFLAETAGRAIDDASLVVLGPLQAHRWKLEDPACPWALTVELWKRDDGRSRVSPLPPGLPPPPPAGAE